MEMMPNGEVAPVAATPPPGEQAVPASTAGNDAAASAVEQQNAPPAHMPLAMRRTPTIRHRKSGWKFAQAAAARQPHHAAAQGSQAAPSGLDIVHTHASARDSLAVPADVATNQQAAISAAAAMGGRHGNGTVLEADPLGHQSAAAGEAVQAGTGLAGPVAEAAETPSNASNPAADDAARGPTLSTFGLMIRAFRPSQAPATAAVPPARPSAAVARPSAAGGVLSRSVAVVQAAVNVARSAAVLSGNHKLSLKVMCGSGAMCLYHCGGSVIQHSAETNTMDDKLARWEFFLGDSAYAPAADASGNRQTIAQISAIEDHAKPGDVIISKEMLTAIGSQAQAEELSDSAARLFGVQSSAEEVATLQARKPPADVQLASHVAARAAALFRMHVVDNVRQRIEAGHYDFINEIRQLTILFMGFPSLRDPNPELAHQLQPVQDTVMAVSRVMHEFQGSFVQFRCDEKGFLAICAFGLPGVSHANNPERGVLAALKTQALVEGLGQRFACGLTTGALLCAVVGSKIRSEYTMFGDAINLSARLMCKAKAGLATIITDEPTLQKADAKAEYRPLEPLMLKGKEHATKVRLLCRLCILSHLPEVQMFCHR
jgi:class 3 adenylate cyclase